MPDKQRVIEIFTVMPEGIGCQKIFQMLSIWCSDQQADADIRAGKFLNKDLTWLREHKKTRKYLAGDDL